MAAAASTTAGLYGRLNRTSTRGFLAYVAAAGACAAVLACFVISSAEPAADSSNGVALRLSSRSDTRVWPDLEFNWRLVVATIVGFLGSAFGTVGGVGGGGIFVPLLNLVLGFDTKSAAALSKCMIMGASASSVWYNLQVSHPTKEAPVIDYKLALLFQPMLMLGITIGVELSVVFPYWLITVLIIILFIGTSSRSFYKGILMWREESRILMETQELDAQSKSACAATDVVIDPSYAEPLLPQHKPTEKSGLETLWFNLSWKNILVLMAAWSVFLVLQILKNNSQACSTFYWVINILQVPAAVSVFLWKAMELCRDSHARRMNGNLECVCEASIEWSPAQLIFCAFCGLLGGTVGGLLGSGGGFILGPLLLELGCIPQCGDRRLDRSIDGNVCGDPDDAARAPHPASSALRGGRSHQGQRLHPDHGGDHRSRASRRHQGSLQRHLQTRGSARASCVQRFSLGLGTKILVLESSRSLLELRRKTQAGSIH